MSPTSKPTSSTTSRFSAPSVSFRLSICKSASAGRPATGAVTVNARDSSSSDDGSALFEEEVHS